MNKIKTLIGGLFAAVLLFTTPAKADVSFKGALEEVVPAPASYSVIKKRCFVNTYGSAQAYRDHIMNTVAADPNAFLKVTFEINKNGNIRLGAYNLTNDFFIEAVWNSSAMCLVQFWKPEPNGKENSY